MLCWTPYKISRYIFNFQQKLILKYYAFIAVVYKLEFL